MTSSWLSALLQMKSIKGSVRNYKRRGRPAQKFRRTSVSMQNELKDVTSEVQAKALAVEPQIDQLADKLGVNWMIEPGASEEGYVVFEIPTNEKPVEFCYSIGIGCCVAVKLG